MKTQPVTPADIGAGRIRIPISGDAKGVFPRSKGMVSIVLNGEEFDAPYDPRLGPGRERSGVLRVGRERLATAVPYNRLPISVDRQRRVVIGGGVDRGIHRQRDQAGHSFVEFAMSDTEHIRLTYVSHQDWAAGPTIRVQKRNHQGRMVRGPEFPARLAGEFAKALVELLRAG